MWLAYQPDLPEEDVESLRDLLRGEEFVIMSPYPGLKSPVVLTAWEVQLELDSVEDERLEEFVDRYQQGPTTPERGASCQDGRWNAHSMMEQDKHMDESSGKTGGKNADVSTAEGSRAAEKGGNRIGYWIFLALLVGVIGGWLIGRQSGVSEQKTTASSR